MKKRIVVAAMLSALFALPSTAGEVEVRGLYTSGVADREPVDRLQTLPRDGGRVYYYTELRGLDGQTVIHRWEYAGGVVSEIPFQVGAERWRVWSSKELRPGATGAWTVTVVDGSGKELSRETVGFSVE